MEIDRHEWQARYDAVRVHDLPGAAKEYLAILKMDPQNEHAALALASLYLADKKDLEATEVVHQADQEEPRARRPGSRWRRWPPSRTTTKR